MKAMAGRRHLAMFASALFAGVFEAAHTVTYEGRVRAWAVGFTVIAVFIEVEALTAALDFGLRRRLSPARSFLLAFVVAMGTAFIEVFVTWWLHVVFGLPVFTSMKGFRPALLTELAAFQGLFGLGLWAIAVVVPFAVHDANTRAKEAEQLRTAAELARLRAHLQP